MAANPVLSLEQLGATETLRGETRPRILLDSVSLELRPGERVAVVTAAAGPALQAARRLLRLAAVLERPSSGRVRVQGQDVTRAWGGRLRQVRRQVQFVGGDPRRSFSPRHSLEASLAEPLQVHGLARAGKQREAVRRVGAAWGLHPLALAARPEALSASLCQRAALARAWLLEPLVLVCERPAARVEPPAARALLAQLSDAVQAAGTAWLWTTTDLDQALAFADRVLRLEGGRLA
jgi:peptide/nickel transport system ATP-binding protein